MSQNVLILALSVLLYSCKQEKLHQVTVGEFKQFVEETHYETDAEQLGSTFIQHTVFDYEIAKNVDWRIPDGKHAAEVDLPVTQVSYNDAIAYCKWAKCKLPSYSEYWNLAKKDLRQQQTNSNRIVRSDSLSIIGNVWELTAPEENDNQIRLAGGSYLCNGSTCDGTNPERLLTVDKNTANSHIGFCILIEE